METVPAYSPIVSFWDAVGFETTINRAAQNPLQVSRKTEAAADAEQLLAMLGSMLTNHGVMISAYCNDDVSFADSVSVTTDSLSLGDPTGGQMPDICSIVQRLRGMGYIEDCKRIYKAKCLANFGASLRRFGIEKSISEAEVKRMEWESLDKMAGMWLVLSPLFRDLSTREELACISIFGLDHGSTLVVGIVEAYVTPFLDFAQAFACCRPEPHRIFRMLDLHYEVISLFEHIVDPLLAHAKQVLSRLQVAAIMSFRSFDDAVRGDVSHISYVTKEEGVHTLTSYVMNYIKRLATFHDGDARVWLVPGPRNVQVTTRIDGNICVINGLNILSSPFASEVACIIGNLLWSLKSKTEQHKQRRKQDGDDDAAFAHFFMMNNIYYIVRKMNELPMLTDSIGGDFMSSLEAALNSRKEKYMDSSWSRILKVLDRCPRLATNKTMLYWNKICVGGTMKAIFKVFNPRFEKIHRIQSRWSACVEDLNLAKDLRESIMQRLIPPYEKFIDQYSECCSSNDTTETLYSVDDVKTAISQLFKGYNTPPPFQMLCFH